MLRESMQSKMNNEKVAHRITATKANTLMVPTHRENIL